MGDTLENKILRFDALVELWIKEAGVYGEIYAALQAAHGSRINVINRSLLIRRRHCV